MAEEGLKDKTIKGTFWSAIDSISQFGVSFLVSIVLARLLSPEDYGLLGLVTIFTTVCTALINGGFSAALIRKNDITDDDYNTAFIINFCMSLGLYAIMFVCAPAIAQFFQREELVDLTRVATLSLVIGSLAIVQRVRLIKRIDFKTQTKISIIASIISGVVGIAMALLNFGVWALVGQRITAIILSTSLLWYFNKWIPKLSFSVSSFKSMFGFGWKIMLADLLDNVWKELYQLVVGKFYSPGTLGQYTRAKSFSRLFSTNLNGVVQQVTYPVLSSIQEEKERMVSAYRRIIKVTMFITFTCMFALGAVSEPLLYCLIGPKWHEAATYLPLICFTGALYPLHAINLNMLKVQGRSDLFLGLDIIKKIIGLVPLFVGAFVGIFPMLHTSICTGIICYFFNSYYPGKVLGYGSWTQIKDIAPSFFVAIFVALSVYFLKLLPLSNWVILPIQFVVGMGVFFILCKITDLQEYKEVKGIIQPWTAKIIRKK